jgi:GTPase
MTGPYSAMENRSAMFTIAIVGRPNVGKSTLFNRLAGKRLAIVHDTPGVTRDRHDADAIISGHSVRLIDTAGFERAKKESLSARMTAQTAAAIDEADLCIFLLDAREGVTTGDEAIALALRRSGKIVVPVANKCEGRSSLPGAEAFALGFGDAVAVSAEHNLGFDALGEVLLPYLTDLDAEDNGSDTQSKRPLRLAIIGRPNVGKSSLFNRLLGSERSLTGPEAGITRDAIAAPWKIGGREVLLHDTAGMRKRARAAGETLELMSVASALEAVRFADCVIVLIDATQPFEQQDLSIADLVEHEGRALVFAINKWDLLEKPAGAVARLTRQRDESLPQAEGAPLVGVSATTGEGLDRLKAAILAADRAWNRHIATAELNRFLETALARHSPPAVRGRRVRVRYMTQPKARPPTFALFGNQLKALPEAYLRYLKNQLREKFALGGAPIRFVVRETSNPYAKK